MVKSQLSHSFMTVASGLSLFSPLDIPAFGLLGGPPSHGSLGLSPSFHPFLASLSDCLAHSVYWLGPVICSTPSVLHYFSGLPAWKTCDPAASQLPLLHMYGAAESYRRISHSSLVWCHQNSLPSLLLVSYTPRNFFVISQVISLFIAKV